MPFAAALDEHRYYLADRARLSAFSRAIGEVVKPGGVVVDLGAGTGVLGLLACRAGAARVYAIEERSIIGLTREIYRANGFADRVVFIKRLSTRVELPEKVDVVLADQVGYFGIDAGILEYFSDARQRFLKRGGNTVPRGIDLYVAPVESPEAFAAVEFWNGSPDGLDFHPARQLAVNTCYPIEFRPEQVLGDPARIASLDLSAATLAPFKAEGCVTVGRAGRMRGLGGWCSAQLAPGVVMTNSPLEAGAIKRRNIFFPVDCPVTVVPGDRILVAMHIAPAEMMVTWKVEVWSGGKDGTGPLDPGLRKARFQHSTFQGMPISQEDLKETQPHFVPDLDPWGKARLTVLTLCDGERTLSEIVQEALRRHPDLFHSSDEAATFVAEAIARHLD